MAVIITNMDMPKSCENCNHWSYHNDEPICNITYSDIGRFDKRLNDCPLKSVDDYKPMLDKIKTEIEELRHYYPMGHDYQIAITRCIAVIDKYKAESEKK